MVGLYSLVSTNHSLGPNNFDLWLPIPSKYYGEKRNGTFAKYVTVHKEQHHVLSSLEQHDYNGIDYHSKVRFLIDVDGI